MYAASLLFSRLLIVAAVALPAFCFGLGLTHNRAWRSADSVPVCHHAAAPAGPVEVEEAAFGVSQWLEADGYIFSETDHIHLVPGTTFGWQLKLRDPTTSVMLREEFVLPAPPAHWGLGADTRLSDDRRTAVTEHLITPSEGWLQRDWSVTEGDPEGAYEMRVFLNDELVRTFKFEAHPAH